MASTAMPIDPAEETIRKLQGQIYMLERESKETYWLIIRMQPKPLEELLERFVFEEVDIALVVDTVMDAAVELPPHNFAHLTNDPPRALCPLCRQGPSQRYQNIPAGPLPGGKFLISGLSIPVKGDHGFAFPLGLKRHLEGFGNQERCGVMKAVDRLLETRRGRQAALSGNS
jgi:hypothetical protein